MRWREISSLPDYQGIPFSTLNGYANGRPIRDERHRIKLGLEPDPRCVNCPSYEEFRQRTLAKPTRWDQYPVSVLKLALEYREEMER